MAQKRNNMFKVIVTHPEVGPDLEQLEPSLKNWIIELLESGRILELNNMDDEDV